MSNQRLIKWMIAANVIVLLCGICFVCVAIGLNFAPNAQPSPMLVNLIPNTPVPDVPETAVQPTLTPVIQPTFTSVPLPTNPPTLPADTQNTPFKYYCDMKRTDGSEHRCYEVTVLPVGDPVAECAGAITAGIGTWAEGSCSAENRVGTCTGGLLILANPPKTYRLYADYNSYDIASATAFCNTLKGQFTVEKAE